MKLDTRKNKLTLDTRDRKDFSNGQAFVAGLLRTADPKSKLHEAAQVASDALDTLAAELPKE